MTKTAKVDAVSGDSESLPLTVPSGVDPMIFIYAMREDMDAIEKRIDDLVTRIEAIEDKLANPFKPAIIQ